MYKEWTGSADMAQTPGEFTHEMYRQIALDAPDREPIAVAAWALPDEATVGEPLHLRLDFSPTDFDLPAGTQLIVTIPRHWRKHLGMAWRELHPELSTRTDRHPGGSFCLVTAHAPSGSGVTVTSELIEAGFNFALRLVIANASLSAGEVLTVYLSDPKSPEIEVPKMAIRHEFATFAKLPDEDFFRPLVSNPAVVAHGGPAAKLRLRVPSVAAPDSEITVRLVVVDGVGENGAEGYDGDVAIWRQEDDSGDIGVVRHSSEKRESDVMLPSGHAQFEYFQAYDVDNPLVARSNPMGRPDDFGGYNVYFGDLHTHYLGLTDDALRQPFEYAYWFSLLDFCACVYQHNSCNDRFTQDIWHHYLDVNEEYNSSGELVTICGCETYISCGHRIAYFRSAQEARDFKVAWERGPEYDLGDPHLAADVPEPEALWAALDGFEAITVPHHTRYIWPADWERPLAPSERLVEIYSRWGTSELGGPHSVQEALSKGHRLGFIASTDNQMAQPGNGPFGVNDGRGLAAVLATDMTREALYDALKARRCYGTSGEQMLVYFALDEMPMGSELEGYTGPRTFTVRAAGTQPLTTVELLRNNKVIRRIEPDALTFSDKMTDDEPLADLLLESRFGPPGRFCFYYLRVKQADGHMAWASPIWIT
jgi:hypothetical protein